MFLKGAGKSLTILALSTASVAAGPIDSAVFQPQPMPRLLEWGEVPPPEEVSVTTEDGLVLTGYRWRPRCPHHVALVFFHGNGGNRYTAASLAAPLRRDDVDLVVASYRGYGGNPGQPSEQGLYRDAAAFIAEAQAANPRRLYLFGYSLGGAVAAHAAGRFATHGLVTLGTFSTLRSVAPRVTRAFIPDWFDNLAAARKLSVPWLLLHGTADRTVPIAEAERLRAAAGDNATLVRLIGAPHNVALDQIANRIWAELDAMPSNGSAGDRGPRPADCRPR